jgi:hypothetical protein
MSAHESGDAVVVEIGIVTVFVSDIASAKEEGDVLSSRQAEEDPCPNGYVVDVLVVGSVGRDKGSLGLQPDIGPHKEAEPYTGPAFALVQAKTLIEITRLTEEPELDSAPLGGGR